MALVKCPDCGREVSEKAPACPHCGRPIASQPARAKVDGPTEGLFLRSLNCGCVVALVIVVLVMLILAGGRG